MADKNLLNKINSSGEVDASMILDTLMYTDALNEIKYTQDITVEAIVKEIYNNQRDRLTSENREAIENVKTYLDSYEGCEVGQMKMHSSSAIMGDDYKGAKSAAFYSEDANGKIQDVYVAFRGTGEGSWYDNGDAFSKPYSEYQQDAAQYFDYVIEELKVDESCNVVTTGHSKGGNQSQFVALASKNAYLVDKCISIDGEGFSPEAVAYFKELYGEDAYNKQVQKLYSVCGDNDPVNRLGIKVIPEDHTTYIIAQKDGEISNYSDCIKGVHAIEWLYNYEDGEPYETTDRERELSRAAKNLSDRIMELPPEERGGASRAIMSLIEYFIYPEDDLNATRVGLNGESSDLFDYLYAIGQMDTIYEVLFETEEGRELIKELKEEYGMDLESAKKRTRENSKKKMQDSDSFVDTIIYGLVFVSTYDGSYDRNYKGIESFLESSLAWLSKKISEFPEKAKKFIAAYEFCGNLWNDFNIWRKETFDNDYKATQEYLGDCEILRFDTGDLHDLAERLWKVNGRLESLDHRMDSLYRNVKWSDLSKIIKVASADFKIGWSSRINNCANCLNDTANRFERIEKQILGMFGE